MQPSQLVANRTLTILAPILATLALLVAALAFSSSSASAGGGISVGGSGKQSSDHKSKYARIWDRTARKQKRWANRTARCESGRDPKAVGGGGRYRGAFQFRKDTWRAAPKSPGGDPVRYSYKTQAVVAVALKRKDGAHHWPTCG
jgi:hypothetical protein